MTSVINDPKPRATSERQNKNRRRIAIFGGILLLALLGVLRPPFVIRPLPGRTSPGSSSGPVETAAAKFVDPLWASKLLPTFDQKAQDIAKVLPEIRADPNAAGEKYGRRESTNPYNYMVKGTGKVTEINTVSQAGTATIEIPGLNEKVSLQIGPVVRGTALRDSTGLVSFNQFSNQLDYADVSKEMNSRALKTAFANVPAASLSGKTVTFLGAFTFDPHSKSPLLITPVKVTF
jgi:predicted lipoprotein